MNDSPNVESLRILTVSVFPADCPPVRQIVTGEKKITHRVLDGF
jgi:hypothetical protein